ncbi:hypothetical protein PRZ48_008454 [Zasmidium cellare]|uniref:Tautomerase cis-CaaD-like domain-containing protein n=1 Tax=Zasmidium cellare TaxID=395010 RepID=A0ABR0EGJ9_ZASCE|nr:hypothetical protein PRZ48_008454 [Zasmidium cellare]
MPFWTIYHTDTAFTTSTDRDALAASITGSYDTIPAFYVVVAFVPLDGSHFYRSGKQMSTLDKPFVRLVVHHLARQSTDLVDGREAGFARGRLLVDRAIEAHVVDKGYLWEYTIAEEDRNLWKIDGFMPPPFGSEAMKASAMPFGSASASSSTVNVSKVGRFNRILCEAMALGNLLSSKRLQVPPLLGNPTLKAL